MQTVQHLSHIAANQSHNNCHECRADNERSFVRSRPFQYDHVSEYLGYVRPRLAQIRAGAIDAARAQRNYSPLWWYQRFITALHRRISSHATRQGRKYSDGYLERLKMADVKCGPENRQPGAGYLREFARRGASTL